MQAAQMSLSMIREMTQAIRNQNLSREVETQVIKKMVFDLRQHNRQSAIKQKKETLGTESLVSPFEEMFIQYEKDLEAKQLSS